jgi:glycosyltransferase involved in cell wall biosynthesis
MATVALLLESDGPGGAERMLLQLADELRRRGHRVVPVGPAEGCGWLAGEFRDRDYEPATFHLRHPVDWRCAAGLATLFRERGVDVVHSHEFTMAVFGAAAARMVGLPHVITMHGGMAFAERLRRRVALRLAFRASTHVVAVSRDTRDRLVEALNVRPERVEVVPNGIVPEPGDGGAVRSELGLGPEDRLVLAVGNLYPVKGHRFLLEAVARSGRAGAGCHVAIAGRGDQESALRECAARLGLSDRVHLLGYRADIADLLAAADVFAMPSLSEGLPLAMVEAMFAGVPVLATAVGGIPDLIHDGASGRLVRAEDPDALCEALRELLGSAPVRARYAAAAREHAVRGYGAAAMVDAYLRLYGVGGAGTASRGPAASGAAAGA